MNNAPLIERLESLPLAIPPCPACNGRGWFIRSAVNQNIVACERCTGTGEKECTSPQGHHWARQYHRDGVFVGTYCQFCGAVDKVTSASLGAVR